MGYAIFFDYNGETYRLPTNPEELEITTNQANKTYEILGSNQIVVPTSMNLREYSFEVEFPHSTRSYVETSGDFKDCYYYLTRFRQWRETKVPIRFIARSEFYNDTNILVLIEEMTVAEKAGEDGDKYVKFKLLEYVDFKPKVVTISTSGTKAKAVTATATTKSSKAKSTYTVRSGDTLWSIAKKYYGNGAKYTTIYNANKDKLKSPNLVYKGQVLTIP